MVLVSSNSEHFHFWAFFKPCQASESDFRSHLPTIRPFGPQKVTDHFNKLRIGHPTCSLSLKDDYINGRKIQWSWDIHFWQNQVTAFFPSWCSSCFAGNPSSFVGTCKILLSFLGRSSGLSFQQLAFWCPLLLQNVQWVFGIKTYLPFSFFRCGLEPLCCVSFLTT